MVLLHFQIGKLRKNVDRSAVKDCIQEALVGIGSLAWFKVFTREDSKKKTTVAMVSVDTNVGRSTTLECLSDIVFMERKLYVEQVQDGQDDASHTTACATANPYADLPHHKIPSEVTQLILNRELESTIEKLDPENLEQAYPTFWKNLLWASEFQAYEDIKLFDMEGAKLKREGKWFALQVPGLAEGRPSVLRGDWVNVTWKGRLYKGRVHETRLLNVLLEFHSSFHKSFNDKLDVVDVRFTFSRTTFRTSHEGSKTAVASMGQRLLMPSSVDVLEALSANKSRALPKISWANRNLNAEQKTAVVEIVKGKGRPLPYIIFGPPGTGKTTTVVETVYQLVKQWSLKVLLVAPSNDAADILVQKLAPFFPPTELTRVLAYSRSIESMPTSIRHFAAKSLTYGGIARAKIVVSTVNLAARFSFYGVLRGHFDALCVEEAGHATEPEVVAVASSLLDFKKKEQPGQLVLAGDPKQLGPVITSDICHKFGMSESFMERLSKLDEVYGRQVDTHQFHPSLITKLVRNYRSHPAILKLPNEMFYDGELQTCGDVMKTHGMAKWEHLPAAGFPVLFHSVHGENLREANSPSWFNPQEAQEVVRYVDLLINQSKPPIRQEDIGIITPYARQAQKIRLALKTAAIENIKVGSVETFQGQERRCIIVSTVCAEPELVLSDLKYNLGFVANEKRFNVAITRAQALLVVIGDPRVLAMDKNNWLPFLKYCQTNDSWVGQEWEEATDCLTDEQLSSTLSADDGEWDVVESASKAAQEEAFAFVNREE